MAWLINAAQLDKFRKNQKSVIILDTSWHLPSAGRDAKQEFLDKHIMDAYFFDIDLFSELSTDLPNKLIRDEKIISEKLSALGIRDDYKIIFYDNSDLHTSCRAFWMFRYFGHNTNQLYVLDGGFKAWQKYGGKTASGAAVTSRKPYSAKLQPQLLRSLDQIKDNVKNPKEQIVDLRHPVRFAGGPEPRPNMRLGHIPQSFCFPYMTMFDKEGCFSPLEKIRKQLMGIGVDMASPIVTTCGSGITAPILNFLLEILNHPNSALYDGSWSEWGSETLYPGEQSLAERPVRSSLES